MRQIGLWRRIGAEGFGTKEVAVQSGKNGGLEEKIELESVKSQ